MVEANSILDGRRLEKVCQVWRSSGVDDDVVLQQRNMSKYERRM